MATYTRQSVTMHHRSDYENHAAATSQHPVFADPSALFSDYGREASLQAQAMSKNALAAAQGTAFQRTIARRSIGVIDAMPQGRVLQGGVGLAAPLNRGVGLVFPRSSIGTGHPIGLQATPRTANPILNQRPAVDLSPLMPGAQPQVRYVQAPNDTYHRTSVYAASGVPVDVPSFARGETWSNRVQQGRP